MSDNQSTVPADTGQVTAVPIVAMTLDQAALSLGVSPDALRSMLVDPQCDIPRLTISGRDRIPAAELRVWVSRQVRSQDNLARRTSRAGTWRDAATPTTPTDGEVA